MDQINRITLLNATDSELVLHNGNVIVVRTDIPTTHLSYDERWEINKAAIKLHETFKEYLTKEINLDNYIQIGSKDTLVIADEADRYALVYPAGKFAVHSPVYYLDWTPKGLLVEVIEDDAKMAKFVYKK